jgi:hypothetical protein
MTALHFYCPTHQLDIDSGMNIEPSTLVRNKLKVVHVPCPHCDKTHRFLLADGSTDEPWVPDTQRFPVTA